MSWEVRENKMCDSFYLRLTSLTPNPPNFLTYPYPLLTLSTP